MTKKSTKIETVRHSLAHIMALAIQELHPGVKFGIGPAIENGFYYDFGFPSPLSADDLPKIEKKMRALIKKDLKFSKKQISKAEAKKIFKDQPYKLELIKELTEPASLSATERRALLLTTYQVGDFLDLCQGPHIKSTKEINPKAFKLTKLAGAYWRGDEKKPMLTRIYGLAFSTEKELKEHLKLQAEAEKRDHRVLGQKLDLFSVSDGLVVWHPQGAIIRDIIEDFWKEKHKKHGYQYVISPHIGKIDIWQQSGHWDFYRQDMYSPMEIDKAKYVLKPMNCPFHVQIYQSHIRSYKDLPIRYCELGTVYRYERPGVLHGLMRVRGFTQDDAHIFCQAEQLTEEIQTVIDLALLMLKTFGFEKYEIDLSVRDPRAKKKYLGDDKIWQKAEKALEYALKKKKLKYSRVEGEAVFYGPKIDIKLIDALGRAWQGPTVQVDFNFPEKFNLTYIDNKGHKKQVVMIHRTVLGSMERFIGILLEHYAGALPVWLAPVQCWIIPVGSAHRRYAQQVKKELSSLTPIRAEAKIEAETVSKKIREGEVQKIPYLLVVGEKELKNKTVRVRARGKGDIGEMKLEKFLEKISKEIEQKK